MAEPQRDVTELLLAWSDGDESAREQLMPLVFDELHGIAQRYMVRESSDHTLQPTALVNELYLRLVDRRRVRWRNRAQFFGFAADMMRKILVDHARGRLTAKRGKGAPKIQLDDGLVGEDKQDWELVALDEALQVLNDVDPRQARVVVLRFFAGLTSEEIGEVLKISATTVKREWRLARMWLFRKMRHE